MYELFIVNLKKDLNIKKTTTLKNVYKKFKKKLKLVDLKLLYIQRLNKIKKFWDMV